MNFSHSPHEHCYCIRGQPGIYSPINFPIDRKIQRQLTYSSTTFRSVIAMYFLKYSNRTSRYVSTSVIDQVNKKLYLYTSTQFSSQSYHVKQMFPVTNFSSWWMWQLDI